MAGSYFHAVKRDTHELRSDRKVVDMLENGGDVYEAVEEMYGMIWYLATKLARAPYDYSAFPEDDPKEMVEEAHENYQTGLIMSPTRRFKR